MHLEHAVRSKDLAALLPESSLLECPGPVTRQITENLDIPDWAEDIDGKRK